MDHRVTILVLTVFGGTLAFTVFTAMLYTSIDADAAKAAVAAEGGGAADAEQREGPSPRQRLQLVVQTLDERLGQWVRDHNGRRPDFRTYPSWEQFLSKTSLTGKPSADALLGPYLTAPPVNPLNKLSSVLVLDEPLRPAFRVPADAVPERAGFVYSTADGCFWGTNGTGKVVLIRIPQGGLHSGPPAPTLRFVPISNAPPAPTTAPAAAAPALPAPAPAPAPAPVPAPVPAPTAAPADASTTR